MDWVARLAEDRIKEAQEEGFFDNLPGKGKPFQFRDDDGTPEDLRMAFKVLKNANCLPMEVELRKEIYNIRALIRQTMDEETRRDLQRKLNLATLKLNIRER